MTDEMKVDLSEWYTAAQAAERLSANAGRKIGQDYVRTLGRYGRVKMLELGTHAKLYWKADINNYLVEARGVKSARAKRQKAALERTKKQKEHAA